MEEPMTDSVLVAEHPAGDRVVGQLTLNVEKTLNSLTREMVDIISDRLEAWARDDNVVAVLMTLESAEALPDILRGVPGSTSHLLFCALLVANRQRLCSELV